MVIQRVWHWAFCLMLWAFGNRGSCQAQVPSEQSQTDSVSLQEVQISARRVGKDVSSASPSHFVNQNDMVLLGMTDLADVLHRLPGVMLKDYGGAGGMKTVSVRGFGSQHTGVVYDGIALSDCQTGEIDLQRYTLNDIKNIGLVVGDNDDIFQPARNISSAATINIVNDDEGGLLSEGRLSKVQLTTGAWGYINPMSEIRYKVSDKLSVGGTMDYVYAENDYPFEIKNVQQTTTQRRENSRMNQLRGELNMTYGGLRVKAYYYDNDRQLPGVVHYYVNDNDETLRERNAFGQAQWKRVLSDKFALKISGKWNWASSDYHNGKPSGGITSNQYWQREGYASAALLYVPRHGLGLDYSTDYIYNSLNSQQETANGNDPKRHSVLQALSAKYQNDRLGVTGRILSGIYRDKEGSSISWNSEHQLSPSVSMNYKLFAEKEWYLRASWKEIMRMPSFRELYYYHMGTPTLSPEKTRQWNVGVTHSIIAGRWQTDGSIDFYLNKVEDKIVSIPINMFVVRSVNIAEVQALGLDVSMTCRYGLSGKHTIGIAGNFSYQQVENRTDSKSKYYGNQIAYTPLRSGSLTAFWENPWVNLSISGDGMSEQWTTNEHSEGTRIAGFMEWSVSAYRTFGAFMLRANITNVFDKQYDIVARYPMPGRGWKVSIGYRL